MHEPIPFLTPLQRKEAEARLEAAQANLDRVLAATAQFDPSDADHLMNLSQRILRLAVKGEHLGPFALTLAGAQMAVDFCQIPEAPEDKGRIIRLDGETLQ